MHFAIEERTQLHIHYFVFDYFAEWYVCHENNGKLAQVGLVYLAIGNHSG